MARRKYQAALDLLDILRSRSVPLVLPMPSTSLFASSSYTPFLDLIESTGRPLGGLVRFCRRYIAPYISRAPTVADEAAALDGDSPTAPWSVLKLLRRIRGTDGLWGDARAAKGDGDARNLLHGLTGGGPLSKRQVADGGRELVRLLREAGDGGVVEAWGVLADLLLFGRHAVARDIAGATEAYTRLATATGDPDAQYALGFLHATRFGALNGTLSTDDPDQGAALLYYTFGALGGAPQAEMAVGYRHWAGIGVRQSCADALPYYKSAADRAMKVFLDGPPGGRHLPPPKTRLADIDGGVFGPGASVVPVKVGGPGAQQAANQHQHAGGATNPTTAQEWDDVIEYYQFHADRGDPGFMFRLGRIYYQGFGTADGIGYGDGQPAGRAPGRGREWSDDAGRDYARALKWFVRIARTVWPRDPLEAMPRNDKGLIRAYDATKDPTNKVDDHLKMVAGLAAGFLGTMHLRGEGVPQDFSRAWLWFQRGAMRGDIQSHTGLGMMHRAGPTLGLAQSDLVKALNYLRAAANENVPQAQVQLATLLLNTGDVAGASQLFDAAIRHGDSFQAFYHLATLNAHAVGRPDLCPVAAAFYKIVAERGDWEHETWWQAERAWRAGDKESALLGYWHMAERGYEPAQSNIAWILDNGACS